jgi:thiamine biosynthesis lipoprotein
MICPLPTRNLLIATLAVLFAATPSLRAERFAFHHEHVLGTSLEIQLEADSQAAAEAAEGRILAEIDRQAKIFSTYEANSELAAWLATSHQPVQVSSELFTVLRASDRWTEESRGAFNPAVELASQAWQAAAAKRQRPGETELADYAERIAAKHWKLDAARSTATRLSDLPLTFNAIAKGSIVDAACRVARSGHANIRGVIVNIGGDLRVAGDTVRQVAIADPFHDAVNAAPATTIFVNNQAVATSGNYRRGFQIVDKWYSHILDPRTALPTDQVASATVVAASSLDADALATICNVLSPAQSIALVEANGAECLLITAEGRRVTSAGWSQLEQPGLFRFAAAFEVPAERAKAPAETQVALADAKSEELLELTVNIELARPPGAQYRRPYAAVWLEDADDFPVRTGLLFLMTKGNGSRWHRDLLRWYKQDNVRKLADSTDLIGTISSATRGPGEYKAVFDGKDDSGKPLKPGKYTLLIEVAREHGTYQIIRQPLELGSKPIEKTDLKSNVEIKSASYEYRAPAEKTGSK